MKQYKTIAIIQGKNPDAAYNKIFKLLHSSETSLSEEVTSYGYIVELNAMRDDMLEAINNIDGVTALRIEVLSPEKEFEHEMRKFQKQMRDSIADILPHGTDVSKLDLGDFAQFAGEYVAGMESLMLVKYPAREMAIRNSYDFVRMDISTELQQDFKSE